MVIVIREKIITKYIHSLKIAVRPFQEGRREVTFITHLQCASCGLSALRILSHLFLKRILLFPFIGIQSQPRIQI